MVSLPLEDADGEWLYDSEEDMRPLLEMEALPEAEPVMVWLAQGVAEGVVLEDRVGESSAEGLGEATGEWESGTDAEALAEAQAVLELLASTLPLAGPLALAATL